MQRDMSYELDDAFSTRNDGEVLLMDEPRPRVLRGGSTTSISRPNAVALRDAGPVEIDAELDSDSYSRTKGLSGTGEVTLPFIGSVNLIHVGVGVAIGLGICWLLKKKG